MLSINTEDVIQFRFVNVRSKLKNLFPFDPKSDIEIIFKNNRYELQIAYLRLESEYFSNFNLNQTKIIKIQEDFNEDYFEHIMKCFYGGVFFCNRLAIFEVWKILQFLKIQYFKKLLVNDIKQNFQKYIFFDLLTFGFVNNVEEVFSSCLAILDNNNFLQLKKNRDQLFGCSLELFKFLINNHNRRPKSKKALNYLEVSQLILDYSQKNQFSQQFCKDLKFQLIEKTNLTADEYRLIFIEGTKHRSYGLIPDALNKKKVKPSPEQILTESAQIISNKCISLDQKENWRQKLKNLKAQFQKGQKDSKSMQNVINNLCKSLKSKVEQSKLKERALNKMESSVRQIEKQIEEKNQYLKSITQRIKKLQNAGMLKSQNSMEFKPEQQQNDAFVESHIIPGYALDDFIGEIKQPNLKPWAQPKVEQALSTVNSKKNDSYLLLNSCMEKNHSSEYTQCLSLIFDKEPISIPRTYLDSLAKIMKSNDFVKKKHLTLLFRRSKTEKSNIGDSSIIKNRPGLLVLLKTSHKKYVGGFISVEIPSLAKADNLCDYQAYIFSLTHNVKMPIMKGQQKSAISLSKHYLLSFANDLMISNDCLTEVSYCQWPGVYQVSKNSACMSARDLTGQNGQFKIDQIQIYEVRNEEVEMVL